MLVQIVDILGDEGEAAIVCRTFCKLPNLLLQPCKCEMGGIGLCGGQVASALVVKLVDHVGIAGKAFRRGNILQKVLVVTIATLPKIDLNATADINFFIPSAVMENREPPLQAGTPLSSL